MEESGNTKPLDHNAKNPVLGTKATEEPEELIEELEPFLPPEKILEGLSREPSIRTWTSAHHTSSVPLLLIDRDLYIFWANTQFQHLYGDLETHIGLQLTRFFSDSFSEERKKEFYHSIKSKKTVYSWRGQVEKKGREELIILSNLLILPIFQNHDEPNEPLAYIVLLDDVSTEHRELLRGTFTSLLEASRLKDNDTGNHIQRVNAYSRRLTETLLGHPSYSEIDREFLENIGYLAAMHDVGKIGTSDNILNKDGPLDDWEWQIMKEHTINGAFILSTYPAPMAKDLALFHHEKWDESGYPYGIGGSMIPLSARIVALADVYDALRMKRSYKPADPHDKTISLMKSEEKNHFDPHLFSHFVEINVDFQRIYEKLRDK